MPRTEVCITIDTEFNVAGALSRPDRYQPIGAQAVQCAVGDREEGLGFLLASFAQSGIRATFFVETLQTCYFGADPMGNLIDRIAGAGHDVELHFHPGWLHFLKPDWAHRTAEANDACSGLSDESLDRVLSISLDVFSRWGLGRPVAARTGNLDVDSAVYRALERFGIPISSSVGLALRRPREEILRQYAGRHWIGKILEMPVLSFHELQFGRCTRLRLLTITACSWPEIETLLWRAREAGISPVVLLTHPTEFIKYRDVQLQDVRRNRINQDRLLQLLQFLQRNSQDFEAVTFRARAADWLSRGAASAPVLRGSTTQSLARMMQNFINDHVWSY
jgi:hypothetical protein